MRTIGLVIAQLIVPIIALIGYILDERAKRKEKKERNKSTQKHTPFSLSDYLDRCEKRYIDSLLAREDKKEREIILWLDLDGLKLSPDGTMEWISRGRQKSVPSIDYMATQCAPMPQFNNGCQNVNVEAEIRNLTLDLNMQIANMNQQIANSFMISQIRPWNTGALYNSTLWSPSTICPGRDCFGNVIR